MERQTSINFVAAEIQNRLKAEPEIRKGTGFYEGNQKVNRLLKQILDGKRNRKS